MGLSIVDTASTEAARQFDLFYENINSRMLRISPADEVWKTGFAARLISFDDESSRDGRDRCCHVMDAPCHAAQRTARDVRFCDHRQIHLNYMMQGDRHVRVGGQEFTAQAGDVFAVDTRRSFDLSGWRPRYRAVKVVFPVGDLPDGRAGVAGACPASLRTHRLYGLLCSICRHLGAELERGSALEASVLAATAEQVFGVILRAESPEAIGDWRQESFLMISREVDRNRGDPSFDLDRLCRALGVSRRYVQRVFERQSMTFSTILRQKRVEFAVARLLEGRDKIESIAFESGYSDLSAFYRAVKRETGRSPGEIRRGRRRACTDHA